MPPAVQPIDMAVDGNGLYKVEDLSNTTINHIDTKTPIYTELLTGNKYHYRVIDCKWTTMTLCADNVSIRKEGLFPAYKGQLAVYTAALGQMQGYTPNYAYIMAKKWKIGTSSSKVGAIRVNIGGTDRWIRFYDSAV